MKESKFYQTNTSWLDSIDWIDFDAELWDNKLNEKSYTHRCRIMRPNMLDEKSHTHADLSQRSLVVTAINRKTHSIVN